MHFAFIHEVHTETQCNRKECDSTFTLNAERLVRSKQFVILNTISA